jgi:ABC-type phosphate transport system substrate-binding protein
VRKRSILSASLVAACTMLGALSLSFGSLPAQAAPSDYAPNGGDVVGVGSDTLQYILDFGADGDYNADQGYNAPGNPFKLVSMDATADSNARLAYLNNSTTQTPLVQNPTVVLRGGAFPVQRPNGSGAGLSALLADTGAVHEINFVRMSSAPGTGTGAQAVTNGWGGLQEFVLGHEDLELAVDQASTNAPAGLSALQLYHIYHCDSGYTTWNGTGLGSPSASGDTIIPEYPQPGSGTGKTFLTDLNVANGGTGPMTPGSCAHISEENDPNAITQFAATTTNPNSGTCSPNCAADAISPMSSSRLNLWLGHSGNTGIASNPGGGYFYNPATPYPGAATATAPGIVELVGTPTSGSFYDDHRALYVVYRWSDQLSSKGWQTAAGLNWAITLFCNPTNIDSFTPFFQTQEGKILIANAGADPSSQSCLSTPFTG